jgi:hypothetical protein
MNLKYLRHRELNNLNCFLFQVVLGVDGSTYMTTEEQVQCNICGGIKLNVSQAKQHASTPSHELNKSKLVLGLGLVRTENYQNDISVIMSWKQTSVWQ